MLKRILLAVVLVLGISTNTQAQAPTANVPREYNTAPDVVPHPAAVTVSDQPVVPETKPVAKPAIDPLKALLTSLRKTDEKRAAAETERNNLWQEKTKIEADRAGLAGDKVNLTARLNQETTRANKVEQQLAEKEKQTATTIAQYQHFSGAIKNLFGLVIVGLLLMVVGMLVLFGKLVSGSRAQTAVHDDILAQLPGKANHELRKQCSALTERLAERDKELVKKSREVEEAASKVGDVARELQESRDRHREQMGRLGRAKAVEEELVYDKNRQIVSLEERIVGLTDLLVLSLKAFRDAAKDFTDMSCPHSLDAVIATLAAQVEPKAENNLELPFPETGTAPTKPS